MTQDALRTLGGFQELPILLSIRLLNTSAPLTPYGFPLLAGVAPGTVQGVTQADAQQAVLLGSLLAPGGQISTILILLNSEQQFNMAASQPPSVEQAILVPVTARQDIAVTLVITQNERCWPLRHCML